MRWRGEQGHPHQRATRRATCCSGSTRTCSASAFDAGLFQPYQAAGLKTVPATFHVDHRAPGHADRPWRRLRQLRPDWFTDQGLPLPTSFADLTAPDLKGKLVVEDPSASSPGSRVPAGHHRGIRAAGTTPASGPPGSSYWSALKDNGVKVVDGWETAYYSDFSGGSGEGDRPLVVSYASSPPAEVTDPTTAADDSAHRRDGRHLLSPDGVRRRAQRRRRTRRRPGPSSSSCSRSALPGGRARSRCTCTP